MEFFRFNLRKNKNEKENGENSRAQQIAQVHGHRDSIAAGLAQSRRGDFDEPKNERDFRDFAGKFSGGLLHADYFRSANSIFQFYLPTNKTSSHAGPV